MHRIEQHRKLREVCSATVSVVLMGFLVGCNASTENTTQDPIGLGQQETSQPAAKQTVEDLQAFCPKTLIRAGTETYRTFVDGVKKDDPGALNSLQIQGTIIKAVRECSRSSLSLNVRVGIAGRAINGPTGATGTFELPVRVAVVRTDDEVLYSVLHKIPVTIPEGGHTASFRFVDSAINVPIPDRPNLIIYVGFDEGPQETG